MTFEDQKAYIKSCTKNHTPIDATKFKDVSEITMMLDFINKEIEDANRKRYEEDTAYMAKQLEKEFKKDLFRNTK